MGHRAAHSGPPRLPPSLAVQSWLTALNKGCLWLAVREPSLTATLYFEQGEKEKEGEQITALYFYVYALATDVAGDIFGCPSLYQEHLPKNVKVGKTDWFWLLDILVKASMTSKLNNSAITEWMTKVLTVIALMVSSVLMGWTCFHIFFTATSISEAL